MYQTRFNCIAFLAMLTVGVPTFGQSATLRLVASQSSINPGSQVTIEAYISNLPVELRGYQIGLDITGGTSGLLTAAPFDGSVDVDISRSDWVFREVADAGELIYTAGNGGDPPRLFGLIASTGVGTQPLGERYLGTFVLKASSGAAGDFEVALVPADSGTAADLILMPVEVTDPSIPATISSVTISVQFVESTCTDLDGDGYGFPGDATCPNGSAQDCDDGDALIHPGASEIWYDGVDQACDGGDDFDQDGDGSRCDASSVLNACPGSVGGDCDDTNASVRPGVADICDGRDNDCDGQVDEDGACGGGSAELRLVASQSFINSSTQVTVEAFISNLPEALHGYQMGLDITGGTSGQLAVLPVDGSVDVDINRSDWVFREVADAGELIYTAGDRNDPPRLFGLISSPGVGTQPTNERYLGTFVLGASSDATGDFEVAIVPSGVASSAELILLPVGAADPIPATTSSVTIHVQFVESTCNDADGDGYGSPGDATCLLGSAQDCNDGDALIHPGASEIWYDGVDQNCDGSSDFDQDGDGFVCDASSVFNACPGSTGGDCDDTNGTVYPGAAELCDAQDNDCDGQTDEDGVCDGVKALLHLTASATSLDSGQRVTVEAYISNLPVALHGYQIGLDITGGSSGQITAAQYEGSVEVDHDRAEWVFRETSDAGVDIISAGDMRFPPRLAAIILPSEIGAQPLNQRYLGTFVLEASDDASGNFLVGIAPPDVDDSGAGTILITVGGSVFPGNVDDPSVIPVDSNTVTVRVRYVGPTCVDGDSDGYGSPGDASCPNGPEEDCNDGDELIHPGADEVWYDGVDQNCDGLDDFDQDADGFVCDASSILNACPGGTGSDCDDTKATVHPGAVELCDGLDNDCNDEIDDSPDCVIPAVSEWGLSVMVLLVLTAGTVVLGRRRPAHLC